MTDAKTPNAKTPDAKTPDARPPDAKGLADIAALPFEAALKELESIVARLERGDVALEESIEIYTRGEALKARCDALLKQAEARIEKITLGADGKPTGATALDVDG